ncbi:phosphatidylinositol 4-phosphate 5-kinase-like protein 1 isoform X2 [Varanus komodoensis]|nr:phosphatidylinositol 4-phosphate 5-kinase-like protein 1 isoform X2 [Varanus komodoensis]
MRTYAGPVFARFRHFLGMADQDYQQSLSCDSPYLQFVGNSKSSADFFLTNDKRFFLKTQHKREIRFLLTQLPKYLDHMEKYPHSILVKFLGVHSITVRREKKKYFIIMQSIFYPHERIIERYDIKGCQVDRWSEVAPEGSNVTVILKDLNFGEKAIHLDQQRPWLVHQVELDTQFLKDLDVMDYSILVGLQPLREDERILNQALIDIIARTVSISCKGSGHTKEHPDSEPDVLRHPPSVVSRAASSVDHLYKMSPESKSTIQGVLALYLSQRPSATLAPESPTPSETFVREVLAPYLMRRTSSSHEPGSSTQLDSSGQAPSLHSMNSSSCLAQNRRFLPSCRNPLHVIDGPEYRYFIGIVDLFTVYSFCKKLEHLWKSIRHCGKNFSTINPSCYARRLCQWVEDHTT